MCVVLSFFLTEVLDEEPLDMHPLPDVKEAILLKKNEINTTKVIGPDKHT